MTPLSAFLKRTGSFRLTVVRHAQTTANLEGSFCGDREVPLTRVGTQMAEMVSENPLLTESERIYSSPAGRAQKTARALARGLGRIPVNVDARLRELSFGQWEGLQPRDVRGESDYDIWVRDPFANAPPGGEAGAQVLSRLLPALEDALADTRAPTFVTHKSPARLLVAYFSGRDARAFRDLQGFGVTSVTRIEVTEGQMPRIAGPSLAHLPEVWRDAPDTFKQQEETETTTYDYS